MDQFYRNFLNNLYASYFAAFPPTDLPMIVLNKCRFAGAILAALVEVDHDKADAFKASLDRADRVNTKEAMNKCITKAWDTSRNDRALQIIFYSLLDNTATLTSLAEAADERKAVLSPSAEFSSNVLNNVTLLPASKALVELGNDIWVVAGYLGNNEALDVAARLLMAFPTMLNFEVDWASKGPLLKSLFDRDYNLTFRHFLKSRFPTVYTQLTGILLAEGSDYAKFMITEMARLLNGRQAGESITREEYMTLYRQAVNTWRQRNPPINTGVPMTGNRRTDGL